MINIFLSRPNDLGEEEKKTLNLIEKISKERGLNLRTIGATDFPNEIPMIAVKNVMNECQGAIILGFIQTKIESGVKKIGTIREEKIHDKDIPTEWNHIEATMAFMLELPLLIIKQNGVDGGIFNIGVTKNFIHTFDLRRQEWIESEQFIQPFNEWYKEVIKRN